MLVSVNLKSVTVGLGSKSCDPHDRNTVDPANRAFFSLEAHRMTCDWRQLACGGFGAVQEWAGLNRVLRLVSSTLHPFSGSTLNSDWVRRTAIVESVHQPFANTAEPFLLVRLSTGGVPRFLSTGLLPAASRMMKISTILEKTSVVST